MGGGTLFLVLLIFAAVWFPWVFIILIPGLIIAFIVDRIQKHRDAKFQKHIEEKYGKDSWVAKLGR